MKLVPANALHRLTSLPAPWVIVAVTLFYIIGELAYNLSLITLVADPDITRETLERCSRLGKTMAAFGLVWSFLVPVLRRWLSPKHLLLAFFPLWWLMYSGINHAYNSIINGISQEVITNCVQLLTYRSEITAGRITDPTVMVGDKVDLMAMIDLPVMAFDQRERGYMAFARHLVDNKIHQSVQAQGGDAVGLARSGTAMRDGYLRIMQAVTDLHRDFVNNSMRVAGDSSAEEYFVSHSGGLQPNAFVTRDQFLQTFLPRSTLPKAQQLVAEYTAVRAILPDGTQIRISDLPTFKTSEEITPLIASKLETVVEQNITAQRERVETGDEARELAGAVLIPPISMTLSLFALITSLGTLLFALTIIVRGRQPRLPLLAYQFIPLIIICALTPSSAFAPESGMHHLEGIMVQEMGIAGPLWQKASGIESSLLGLIGWRG